MLNTENVPDAITEAIGRINVVQHLLHYFEDPELKGHDTGGWETRVIRELLDDVADSLQIAVNASKAEGGAR